MTSEKRTGNAPEGTRFHLRFDEEEAAMIEVLATDRGVSFTALFRVLVREAYARKELRHAHAPGAPGPDLAFLAEHGNAHARARAKEVLAATKTTLVVAAESESEIATESEQHLRWPHCLCLSPTPWASRKLDGRWSMTADEPELEQRTCLVCGASKSREIGR